MSVTQFCASKVLWYYDGPTYNKKQLQFALVGEEAERNQALLALRGERNEAVMTGNIEAADRWTVEHEAQQRVARGPELAEVEEPAAPWYTPEEFAEMQAALEAARADRERKRQAAEGLVFHNKRSRNH